MIESGTDVFITHNPPKGILDYVYGRERAVRLGVSEAVAASQLGLHCFGRIHELGLQANFLEGRYRTARIQFTNTDNDKSVAIEDLG